MVRMHDIRVFKSALVARLANKWHPRLPLARAFARGLGLGGWTLGCFGGRDGLLGGHGLLDRFLFGGRWLRRRQIDWLRCRGCRVLKTPHEIKPIVGWPICPDFRGSRAGRGAQAPSGVETRHWNVQMERYPRAGKVRP